jgi:hypothetical protein
MAESEAKTALLAEAFRRAKEHEPKRKYPVGSVVWKEGDVLHDRVFKIVRNGDNGMVVITGWPDGHTGKPVERTVPWSDVADAANVQQAAHDERMVGAIGSPPKEVPMSRKDLHPDPDAVIPREEVLTAVTTAFMQVHAVQGPDGPGDLAQGDDVYYQSPDGRVHPGPLTVVLTDEARTVMIAGALLDNAAGVQLRVNRSELVRVKDAESIAVGIIAKAHPCPHCSAADDPAGLPKPAPPPERFH